MKSKENYIKYFTDNVDEFELLAYVCQAIFNLDKKIKRLLAEKCRKDCLKKYYCCIEMFL